MARKPIITRTITTNAVTVLALDTVKAEPFNMVVTIKVLPKDREKLLKKIRENNESAEIKIASIVDVKPVSKLYAMDEELFIANAYELDPETRKVVKTEIEE